MKMYALCPVCGYKLLKGSDLVDVEIKCPRCSRFLMVSVKNEEVKVIVINKSTNK